MDFPVKNMKKEMNVFKKKIVKQATYAHRI